LSVESVGEGEPDPNCLHCQLPAVIEEFRKAHPHKPAREVVGELRNTLGDLFASNYLDLEPFEFMLQLSKLLQHVGDSAIRARKAFDAQGMRQTPGSIN
jgi:hypothetical protein